jgi:hypothetical protein
MRAIHSIALFLLFVSILAGGCAAPTTRSAVLDPALVEQEARKQQEIALQDYMGHVGRLQRVGMPVLMAAVPLCKDDVSWSVGAMFATLDDFPKERRDAARTLLRLDHGLQVVHVVEGGPAARQGLQVGDRVMTLNGAVPPEKGQITQRFAETLREQVKDGAPARFVIKRDGAEETVTVEPIQICDYPLNVIEDDAVNAFADGDSINVFTGMMRFVESDSELATVVGHELAHNAMGHMTAKMINAIPGLALDILAALIGVNTQGAFTGMTSQAFSKEFEAEADYVGLYAVAMADIDIDPAPNFWRRMGVTHSESIKNEFNASHPSTPERFVHLDQVVAEIKNKKTQGIALLPDKKE